MVQFKMQLWLDMAGIVGVTWPDATGVNKDIDGFYGTGSDIL